MADTLQIIGIESISRLTHDLTRFRPARSVELSTSMEVMIGFRPDYLGPNTFNFDEVAVGSLDDAYITKTGAVVTASGFVVRETLEGDLQSNGISVDDSGYFLKLDDCYVTGDKIFAASKYGTFNYSVFLHEVMPAVYISSFLLDRYESTVNLNFIKEVSPAYKAKMLGLANAFVPEERIVSLDSSLTRVKKVKIVKSGAAAEMARLKWIIPAMARELSCLLPANSQSPKRVYICRERGAIREVSNRDEVIRLVEEWGFVPVELSAMTVEQQAEIFFNADFILAEHGAGLANLWYCRAGCTVIELYPEPLVGRWIYRNICRIQRLKYIATPFFTPEEWIWNKDKVDLPADRLTEVLSLALD